MSSRPSWTSAAEVSTVSLLMPKLAASMFTALTFIVSTEGVIYVFFIICICFLWFHFISAILPVLYLTAKEQGVDKESEDPHYKLKLKLYSFIT